MSGTEKTGVGFTSRHVEDQDAVPPDVFDGCTQQGAEVIAHYLMRGSVTPPSMDHIRIAQMLNRLAPYLAKCRPDLPQ